LEAAHGRPALLAALDRAITFKCWRASEVASILTAGTGVANPRQAGPALQLDLPVVPVRALTAYSIDAMMSEAAS